MFFCLYLLIVLITMLTNEGKMIRSGFCEIIVHFIEESDRKAKRKCFYFVYFFFKYLQGCEPLLKYYFFVSYKTDTEFRKTAIAM